MKQNLNKIIAAVTFVLIMIGLNSCEQETYAQGKRLYTAHCENCHMDDGTGLAKLIPPLAHSDYLRDQQSSIACIIRNGQNGPIIVNGTSYNQEMPGAKYTGVQVTNIINYINNAWGNDFGVVNLEAIETSLSGCR